MERFDECVSRAVARHVHGRERIGVMLSGGLDSVPISYWIYRHQESNAYAAAYSWSLRKFPEADESALIQQSADMIGMPVKFVQGDALWRV